MKRFEFRLERVLNWRRSRLDLETAALGRLHASAQAIDLRRQELETERSAAARSLVTAGSVDAQQLAALDAFRGWVRQERERLARERAACERKIEEQRRIAVEAQRSLRLLERLRERRWTEWETEFARELDGLAGELHLARLTRASRGSPP